MIFRSIVTITVDNAAPETVNFNSLILNINSTGIRVRLVNCKSDRCSFFTYCNKRVFSEFIILTETVMMIRICIMGGFLDQNPHGRCCS